MGNACVGIDTEIHIVCNTYVHVIHKNYRGTYYHHKAALLSLTVSCN